MAAATKPYTLFVQSTDRGLVRAVTALDAFQAAGCDVVFIDGAVRPSRMPPMVPLLLQRRSGLMAAGDDIVRVATAWNAEAQAQAPPRPAANNNSKAPTAARLHSRCPRTAVSAQRTTIQVLDSDRHSPKEQPMSGKIGAARLRELMSAQSAEQLMDVGGSGSSGKVPVEGATEAA